MSFSWQSLIGTVAPTVATALGGPLAGLAVEAVGKVMGLSDQTVAGVQKALTQAPLTADQIVALKQAEDALKTRMAELQVTEDQLSAQNVEGARNLQESTKDWVPAALAVVVTIGFFGILGFMLVNSKTLTDQPVLMVMLGALGAAWASIINFYFGSSSGSKSATAALTDIAKSS